MESKEYKEPFDELLTAVLHDIQSPLRFIGTISQELAANCLTTDKKTLKEHLIILNSGIIALQHYCSKIYNWKKNIYKKTIATTPQKISDIFTDIKNIYSPLIAFKKIKFIVIETDLNCFVEKEILFIIILNLIDNAYKNTTEGCIILQASLIKNNLLIIVSDTGKGMDQDKIHEILDDKMTINKSTFGYHIIKDLLKRINGQLKINSNKNSGTDVIISLSNPEKYDNVSQGS